MEARITIIQAMLEYDPATGLFRWRDPSPRQPTGWFKGVKGVRSYRRIWINGRHYLSHVIAWVLMTGRFPSEIDHIDHNSENNKWKNLREVTRSQNMRNRVLSKNNKTGHHGVSIFKTRQGKIRYRVSMTVDKKEMRFGLFNTIEEAVNARKQAEEKHGYSYYR